eukprot:6033218-Prymnesium_polylepis.1
MRPHVERAMAADPGREASAARVEAMFFPGQATPPAAQPGAPPGADGVARGPPGAAAGESGAGSGGSGG